MKILKDFFSGPGNESWELGRALWALSVLAACAYQGIDIFVNHSRFNAMEFCGGIAALLAAGGFGIKQKDSSAIHYKQSTKE